MSEGKTFFHADETLQSHSMVDQNTSCDGIVVMAQEVSVNTSSGNGNFMHMNGNFRSSRLERKKWSTSEGLPFVPENFHLMHAFHLYFKRLTRKFWVLKWKAHLETSCHGYTGYDSYA